MQNMSVNVTLVEAKGLSNVNGMIRCRVELKQGIKKGASETTRPVEESTSPDFGDEKFDL